MPLRNKKYLRAIAGLLSPLVHSLELQEQGFGLGLEM
jgi:hypothetical protein